MSTTRDAHPMNAVSYRAAQEFCVWDGGRLPTEAEWEFAVRGRAVASEGHVSGRLYPWGDTDPQGLLSLARFTVPPRLNDNPYIGFRCARALP